MSPKMFCICHNRNTTFNAIIYLTFITINMDYNFVFPKSFNYDFNYYNDQLQANSQYYTADGWKIFLNQLNIYVNYNNVQSGKLFVTGVPTAAPTLLNKGILPNTGQYGWWVRMPVRLDYAGYQPPASQTLVWQVLVVRVPTLDNLTGVGIQNIVLAS